MEEAELGFKDNQEQWVPPVGKKESQWFEKEYPGEKIAWTHSIVSGQLL